MTTIRRLLAGIDWISEHTGRVVSWVTLIMILVVSYNVFMRYFLTMPTVWSFDMNYMLGGAMIALGLGFVMKHRENVRIDVVSARFSPRTRLWIEVVFGLLFFTPVFFFISRVYWLDFINAVKIGEKSMQSCWYPPLWPFKLALAAGFTLFLVQGLANAIRDLSQLVEGRKQ